MRALTVAPGLAGSARVEDIPEPPQSDGAVLVRTLALGVCGTDREIVSGNYGWAPPGEQRLVIGHRVARQGAGGVGGMWRQGRRFRCRYCPPARSRAVSGLRRGRVGHVPQRPLHRTRHQGAQRLRRRYFRIEPDFLVKVDPSLGITGVLLEPTSIVAKAWDHHRAHRPPFAFMAAEDASWSPAPARSASSPRSSAYSEGSMFICSIVAKAR